MVLPNLAGGGAERVQLLLAEEFKRRGHTVTFIVRQNYGALRDQAEQTGKIISLDCARVRQVLPRLTWTLRRLKPDGIVAAMWPLNVVTSLANRLAERPAVVIAAEHTDLRNAQHLKPAERAALKQFGGHIYGLADALVAVSYGVADSLVETASVRREAISVIHNPIRPVPDTPLDPADRPLVAWWRGGDGALVALGSIKPAKAYGDLVAALAYLRMMGDYRLVIIGDGPDRAALEAIVAAAGLGEYVRLVGYRAEPYPLLRQADVFVLSSHWEGFGNVLVEALAAGLRVVATDCRSGPAEILEGGCYGCLVPVADPAAMADAVHATLRAPFDADGARVRASDFTPDAAASRYLALMQRA